MKSRLPFFSGKKQKHSLKERRLIAFAEFDSERAKQMNAMKEKAKKLLENPDATQLDDMTRQYLKDGKYKIEEIRNMRNEFIAGLVELEVVTKEIIAACKDAFPKTNEEMMAFVVSTIIDAEEFGKIMQKSTKQKKKAPAPAEFSYGSESPGLGGRRSPESFRSAEEMDAYMKQLLRDMSRLRTESGRIFHNKRSKKRLVILGYKSANEAMAKRRELQREHYDLMQHYKRLREYFEVQYGDRSDYVRKQKDEKFKKVREKARAQKKIDEKARERAKRSPGAPTAREEEFRQKWGTYPKSYYYKQVNRDPALQNMSAVARDKLATSRYASAGRRVERMSYAPDVFGPMYEAQDALLGREPEVKKIKPAKIAYGSQTTETNLRYNRLMEEFRQEAKQRQREAEEAKKQARRKEAQEKLREEISASAVPVAPKEKQKTKPAKVAPEAKEQTAPAPENNLSEALTSYKLNADFLGYNPRSLLIREGKEEYEINMDEFNRNDRFDIENIATLMPGRVLHLFKSGTYTLQKVSQDGALGTPTEVTVEEKKEKNEADKEKKPKPQDEKIEKWKNMHSDELRE